MGMSATTNSTPTGQDYLALAMILPLAHVDSLERQAMFEELYSSGDCPPHSYEENDQTPDERFETLAQETWNPEFVRIARDEIMRDPNYCANTFSSHLTEEEKERIASSARTHLATPEIPSTLPVSEVRDLEFIRVSDPISHKWAVWEVRFTYDGKPCCGFLGGCPTYPHLMNEEKIEDCEIDF